ncbi:hypothetical protein ORI89_10090 [Sphingobacterium sp. UT-1RO-CII-1]|uniref:hypothetical protein n=1 Tax=Sphingobacterium sp. UT-1RO-CII-1 TaxID=2995225 RepID=UPI00227C5E60|nr:hypothetical protein [Sphingobacterium sp. UT-1RO-CII-1]MCY4780000.1 hypothetical protein [Sphingobacterium sp. UT-1RO-CII-1]
MSKEELFVFINSIKTKINTVGESPDLEKAYNMVDEAIKQHDFYQGTPYFFSEWLIVKEQVLRKDDESFGFFDRFLDNILYSGDIGLFDAYTASQLV